MSESDYLTMAWLRWLGTLTILFGLLLFASHANELMIQYVIVPDTAASTGAEPDCRADELEEEGLSLAECELMVASVQIRLASQPSWFRASQIGLSTSGALCALLSIVTGLALLTGQPHAIKPAIGVLSVLLSIDLVGFMAATNTGPLLRALYLEKLLLWNFLHLCFLLAFISFLLRDNSSRTGTGFNEFEPHD